MTALVPVAAAQLLALAWVRWFVLLLVQPILRIGIGARWWSVAAVLAGVLALGDATRIGGIVALDGTVLVVALAIEALVGLGLGMCLSLGAHAVLGAGAAQAALLRLPPGPWLALVAALVLGAALELGLHHAALRSGALVQQVLAIGDAGSWRDSIAAIEAALPTWLAGMTVLALALATPALLVAAAVEIAFAAIARGPGLAPALAQAGVATARLAAVLVALGASWAIDLPQRSGGAWAPPTLPTLGAGSDRLTQP